ncbi:MAG: type II toxin-antitoxin system VapC family toxin, partial [bacterium]|nr:type II toxin-antitoxin system VapC family toxin [bacterium]
RRSVNQQAHKFPKAIPLEAREERLQDRRSARVPCFDTSFLVPLILPEAASEPVATILEDVPAEDLTAGHWTRVEFASLLAREVRMGNPDVTAARKAGARIETMVEESCVALLANRDESDRATQWLGCFETGLR